MLLEKIRAAGIVGAGGAGFPTATKLNGNVDYLIINAAECEPLLKTDHYVMRNEAIKCVQAIDTVGKELAAQNVVIATKGHYHEEIKALQEAIDKLHANIEIFPMKNFYPAGDEQTMVFEVTGRTVAPGGIPLSVGCIVSNITTMLNIYYALKDQPLTHKLVTVTGAVNNPTLVYVPIGTSFTECLSLAGGTYLDDYLFLNGGPMMGKLGNQDTLDEQVVTKTTSGIIILEDKAFLHQLKERSIDQIINQAKSSCIQCRLCTELCPRYQIGHPIHPHRVMRHLAVSDVPKDIDDDPVWKQALLCCECGICEVIACPMGLSPRQVNIYVKKRLAEKGIRVSREIPIHEPAPQREYQLVPPKNILVKMGLQEFESIQIHEKIDYEAKEVFIPTKMHIGAPCTPTVKVNDTVAVGQIIADVPEGALGAAIHASIDGVVVAISDQLIHIKKK